MTRTALLASALFVGAALVAASGSIIPGDTGSYEIAKKGRGGDADRWEWRSDSKPTDSGNRGWNREG